VRRQVFRYRSNVNHNGLPLLDPLQERVAVHGVQGCAIIEEAPPDLFDFGQSVFSQQTERPEEVGDQDIPQPIQDVAAILARVHEPCCLQHMQVLGSIRHRHLCFGSQSFDRTLRLAQQVEQLQPFGAGKGFPNPGELAVGGVFEGTLLLGFLNGVWHIDKAFN
jgi:hypothetical protein